jgi:hypothetical protein
MTAPAVNAPRSRPLTSDEILRIARQDAEGAYPDLRDFRITLMFQPDGWHVDYDLVEPLVAGGGPHYVIDGWTGAILSKRYEQ